MTSKTRPRRALAASIAAAALVLAPAIPSTQSAAPAFAEQSDPQLDQIIDPNQAQGTGRVVLDDGHIDYGPTLNTGEWIIQIHDDTSQPSYWRMPSDVVANVNDSSKLAAPDDPAYGFLGLEPDTEVWVIPQVRKPGVVWAGWNTQEPGVLDALSMGTTQRILGVEGPGDVSVYLQSGNFGEPQPLWSTLNAFPQESWIEVNTHTHANWVFSEPGIYLVELEFEGALIDGSTVVARDTLSFAVGDGTDAEAAFDMAFDEALAAEPSDGAESQNAEVEEQSGEAPRGSLAMIVGIVAAIVVLALLVAIIVVVASSRRAKQRSRAARAARAQSDHNGGEG